MDKNITALLHTLAALAAAMCATHPQPLELDRAFLERLHNLEDTLHANSTVPGLVSAWAATFRQHIWKPPGAPDEGGTPPPTE